MKKIDIDHPRVFTDEEWAGSYYKRQKWNITKVGQRLARTLKKDGFSSGRILDVGCGFAAVAVELIRMFPDAELIGIDMSEPLLEVGRKDVQEAGFGDKISLRKGDAHKLDFEDNSFDVVVNSFLLHIVKDPVAMLNELERVAKPGARILITDLRRIFLGHFVRKLKMSYTLPEAVEIIHDSGLRKGRPGKGFFWWDYHVLNKG